LCARVAWLLFLPLRSGSTLLLGAILAGRRFGTLRARVVEAEHVRLTHRPTALTELLGMQRRFPAGELVVRRGRPELRLLDGAVALMDVNRRVRVQLDGSYRPAPPVREPEREAVTAARRMRPLQGKPVLVFSDEKEVPLVVVDAARGLKPAPGREAGTKQGRAADGEAGAEVDDVAGWARSLLEDQSGVGEEGGVSGSLAPEELPTEKPSWERPRQPEDDSPNRPASVEKELDTEKPQRR